MRVEGMHVEIAKARGEVRWSCGSRSSILEEQDVTFRKRSPQAFDDALKQRV